MKIITICCIISFITSIASQVVAQSDTTNIEQKNTILAPDVNAVFPKGIDAFYEYIAKNIKYPKEARKNNIEGKVVVEFIINKKGQVEFAKILEGIGYGCDAEALRVIKSSPNWIPAYKDGKPVKVRMSIPIKFYFPPKKKKKNQNDQSNE